MLVNASEQIFEDANLLWLDLHGGLMFLIHAHGTWQGCPDKWDGQEYEPIGVEEGRPAIVRGFGYLFAKARRGFTSISLFALGQPVSKEKGYHADVLEHTDGWTITDSYGRKLELRVRLGEALWSISHWP